MKGLMPNFLYVVVHVTYDYYRFQDNCGVGTSRKSARNIAEICAKEKGTGDEAAPLAIIEDRELSAAQDGPEIEHIYIEKHGAID